MTTDTRLSGWCAPAPGMRHTEYEHAACRPALGCECEAFGGHGSRLVERDSGRFAVESGAETMEPQPRIWRSAAGAPATVSTTAKGA